MHAPTHLIRRRTVPCAAFHAALLLVVAACAGHARHTVAQTDATPSGRSSAEVARLLSSRNPVQRREAAEDLARASAAEHARLVEGYRVQEKDSRVRLALDWALYRMGKTQALFPVVRELDTSRKEQAFGYLTGLDAPDPLYVFLPRVNGNTQIRLLELLARLGDAGTLEQVRPFTSSLDPGIADAARFAEQEISRRLADAPSDAPKRPRLTGKRTDDTP